MIEQAVYARLAGDAAVAALVAARIYPSILPQNPTLPAISYSRVSRSDPYSLSGRSDLRHIVLEINAWAETYAGSKALAQAIEDAMDADGLDIKAVQITDQDLYESDTKIYRVFAEYSIWK